MLCVMSQLSLLSFFESTETTEYSEFPYSTESSAESIVQFAISALFFDLQNHLLYFASY